MLVLVVVQLSEFALCLDYLKIIYISIISQYFSFTIHGKKRITETRKSVNFTHRRHCESGAPNLTSIAMHSNIIDTSTRRFPCNLEEVLMHPKCSLFEIA